jgi:ISXO2-like transposase domain
MLEMLSEVFQCLTNAIAEWAQESLASSCIVVSDGLACSRSVTSNGCTHQPIVTCGRHPDEPPEFKQVNAFLGNLKTSINCIYKGQTSKSILGDRWETFSPWQIDAAIYLVWLRDYLWLHAIAHLTLSGNFGLWNFIPN